MIIKKKKEVIQINKCKFFYKCFSSIFVVQIINICAQSKWQTKHTYERRKIQFNSFDIFRLICKVKKQHLPHSCKSLSYLSRDNIDFNQYISIYSNFIFRYLSEWRVKAQQFNQFDFMKKSIHLIKDKEVWCSDIFRYENDVIVVDNVNVKISTCNLWRFCISTFSILHFLFWWSERMTKFVQSIW